MAYWVLGIDKMEQELMNGRSKPLSRAFAPLAKYVYIFLAALVVFFSFIIRAVLGKSVLIKRTSCGSRLFSCYFVQ